MNIKLLFISLLTVLTYGQMSAEQLTPSEALARVTDSQQNSQIAQRVRRAKATNQLRLAYTSRNANDNTFYVYNNANEGGFILVSADDCVPSLIGYTEKGAFNYDALPSNVKWYLAYFDSQVKRQIVSGRKSVARASRTEVSPLLGKTVWDQSTPFNDLCPTYNNEHALTGCVATAMAQVMRYHKWPKRGNGSITYTFDFAVTESKTVSKTISNYSFDHALDWDNMIDYYSEDKNYTSAQGKAVAQLMADCGAAAQASYGLEAANGTGALSENAANGMAKYLGYDSGIKVVYQEDEGYTQAQFENLVYTELAANRPVILGGNGETGEGGHEFVCDGCNASGLFHINWGWSGMYDGYFALSGQGLVPEGTGSGGAAEGDSYGYQLEAIVGIKPNGSSSATDPTDPDTPDTPDTPEEPDEPEDPDTPDEPEDPSDPSDADTPIIPQGTIFGEVLDQITVDKTTLNPTTSGVSTQTLTLSSSKGIKVSNYENYYLDMGVEFIDMATGQASDKSRWLVNFGEYNGQMDSKGNALITSITVDVPAGLQAGHKYTVTPVIWRDLDENLSGNSLYKAMWNQREYPKVSTASYLPVITIAGGTAIVDINSANPSNAIYDIQGRVVTSGSLAPGLYIMNGKKILKK